MKNRFLRLASGLFVLCLITTSVISGTYAKYVTGDNGNDTARVAKWGVELSTSGTLFGTDYAATDAGETADSIVLSSTNVASAGDDDVVAPGTRNFTGFQIKVTGQPEVAYKLDAKTYAANNEDIYLAAGVYGVMVEVHGVNDDTDMSKLFKKEGDNYVAAGNYAAGTKYYAIHDACELAAKYLPLQWAVSNSGADSETIDVASQELDTIAENLVVAMKDIAKDANEAIDLSYTLTWEWAFERNNAADTILGNIAAGKAVVVKDGEAYKPVVQDTNYNLEVYFGIEVSAAQVN